jgi:hypothetical protein
LDYKKLELFKIDKKVKPVNYKLKLLNTMRIHLIFYISLLELVPDRVLNTLYTEAEPINPNTIYEIEKILDYKYIRETLYYLIK